MYDMNSSRAKKYSKRIFPELFSYVYQVNDRVEGDYRYRGKWYKGRITRVRADHTVDILYDDGDIDNRMVACFVRPFEDEDDDVSDKNNVNKNPDIIPFLKAVSDNNVDLVLGFIKASADPSQLLSARQKKEFNRTALMIAAGQGFLSIVELLVDNGADINALDVVNCTALMHAAKEGHVSVVAYLAEKGSDINAVDEELYSPLHFAASRGHEAIVKYLLENGAEPNLLSDQLWTPIMWAADNGELGNLKLLLSYDVELNHQSLNEGWTALITASIQGHQDIVEALIDAGADITIQDKSGKSAFVHAAFARHKGISQILLNSIMYDLQNDEALMKSVYSSPHQIADVIQDIEIVPSESYVTLGLDPISWPLSRGQIHMDGCSEVGPNYAFFYRLHETEREQKPYNKFWKKHIDKSMLNKYKYLGYLNFDSNAVISKCKSFSILVPNIGHLSFLRAVYLTATTTGRNDLFDLDVTKIAIQFAWQSYGSVYHLVFFVIYIVYLIILTISNIYYGSYIQGPDSSVVTTTTAGSLSQLLQSQSVIVNYLYVIVVYTSILTIFSILQWSTKKHMKYLSFGTLVDLFAYSLILASCYYRITIIDTYVETDTSATLAGLGFLTVCTKMFYFLRPYHATGSLVVMIEAIMWDIKYYILMILLILFAFSQTLFILSYNNPNSDFFTVDYALLHTYQYMTSPPAEPSFGIETNVSIIVFVTCLFTFITTIILLNLLISIMSHSYEQIQEIAEITYRNQVCQILLEQFRFSTPYVPPFLHYLKREVDVLEEGEEKKNLNSNQLLTALDKKVDDQFYPNFYKHDFHEHLLTKKNGPPDDVYFPQGKYICQVCNEDGEGWTYHCEKCWETFDVYTVHPRCCIPLVSHADLQQFIRKMEIMDQNIANLKDVITSTS